MLQAACRLAWLGVWENRFAAPARAAAQCLTIHRHWTLLPCVSVMPQVTDGLLVSLHS